MKTPDHHLELFGTAITGWPATAIIVTFVISLTVVFCILKARRS